MGDFWFDVACVPVLDGTLDENFSGGKLNRAIEIWWDTRQTLANTTSLNMPMKIYISPANRDPVPCDTCERAAICIAENVDCTAFRQWTDSGRVVEEKIGRILRAI